MIIIIMMIIIIYYYYYLLLFYYYYFRLFPLPLVLTGMGPNQLSHRLVRSLCNLQIVQKTRYRPD